MFYETVSSEDIDKLPLAAFEGSIAEVRTSEESEAALDYLEQQSVLGFDTETRPRFAAHAARYKPALLQLASGDRAFLFRLHYSGISPRLAALLANPEIVKVGAAIKDDIRGLQVFRTFHAAGFTDLQALMEPCGIKEKSLRKMAAIVLGIRISKGQQLSNWENRTLTAAQQLYAAIDAWVCREMYCKLRAEGVGAESRLGS